MITSILENAKEIISTPDKWCKGSSYRNEFGQDCAGEEAKQCCLLGAVCLALTQSGAVALTPKWDTTHSLLIAAVRRMSETGSGSVATFNDHPERTHEEIIRVLDLSITYAKRSL